MCYRKETVLVKLSPVNPSIPGPPRLTSSASEFIYAQGCLLTEGVDVFPDSQGEAAARVVNAEENHRHILRGANSFSL